MAVFSRVPEPLKKAGSLAAAQGQAQSWLKENQGFLKEALEQHQDILISSQAEKFQQAYDGYLTSIEERDKSKGDDVNHKIQATLGGLMVDFVVDYMLGKPMIWAFEDKADNGNPDTRKEELLDEYRQSLLDILETEEGQRVLRETLTMGSVSGYWGIMAWLDREDLDEEALEELPPEIDYEDFPIQELIPVYNTRGKLKYVIRTYEEDARDDNGETTGEKLTRLEIYDDRFILLAWRQGSDGEFELDTEGSEDGKSVFEHGAARIPIAVFVNGAPASYKDRKKRAGVSDYSGGIFDLVEAYAHGISDKANLADRLQDALLVLTGVNLGETQEDAQREVMAMQRARAIAFLSKESSAAFIAPPQEDVAVENHLNRLRDTLHEKGFIPKLSDLSGATATEIKVKYAGTDIKAGKKEVYFTGSVKRLIAILTDFINGRRLLANNVNPELLYDILSGRSEPPGTVPLFNPDWVSFTFNRNMPQNYQEIAQIVSTLSGIVPDSYLYELLWFIPDPQAALDEMAKQKESSAATTTATLFPPGFTDMGGGVNGAAAPGPSAGDPPNGEPGNPAGTSTNQVEDPAAEV